MNTTLTKRQTKTLTGTHNGHDVIATVRHDDQCGNGHNTFAITADVYESGKPHTDRHMVGCGCVHDEITEAIPELAPLIKWHLTSTDGPMHYIANTVYHASDVKDFHHFVYLVKTDLYSKTLLGLFNDTELAKVKEVFSDFELEIKTEPTYKCHEPNLEHARSTAIWTDATLEQLTDETALNARLPALMAEFKSDVESLGFTY